MLVVFLFFLPKDRFFLSFFFTFRPRFLGELKSIMSTPLQFPCALRHDNKKIRRTRLERQKGECINARQGHVLLLPLLRVQTKCFERKRFLFGETESKMNVC